MMVDERMITNPGEFLRAKIIECSDLDELGNLLGRFLSSGLSVWPDGSLCHTRARVGQIMGLRLEVYPHDHDPPHFHVRSPETDAKFSLADCSLLGGRIDRGAQDLVVYFFQNGGREKLLAGWSRMHPQG
jgi:hypothetical protein